MAHSFRRKLVSFINIHACKIGSCLRSVLLSTDNTFPFLNHTFSKDGFPFFTLEADFMLSAQKSGVYRVGGAGCE